MKIQKKHIIEGILWTILIAGSIYFCITLRNTVIMPTPESIAADQIRKNRKTCGHRVVQGSELNP